jgi:hypothetical protein
VSDGAARNVRGVAFERLRIDATVASHDFH